MECPEQRTPPEVLLSLHLLPLLRSFRFVPFSQNWFRFNTRRGNKSGPLSGLIRDNPEFVASACAVGQWDRFGVCDNKLVCNRYRLTHSKQHLAERFGVLDEIEDRPRYNIAPTPVPCDGSARDGAKNPQIHNRAPGTHSFLGERHEHRNSNAQCPVGDCHDDTGIRSCISATRELDEWQKMGSVKQLYCFELGEGEVFSDAPLSRQQ